jgi:transcriptional regulator with XRE-family HTH domain
MTLSELRQRRRALGLTQAQLARLLGVHSNTVAHWEQGVQRIPPFLGLALAWIEHAYASSASDDMTDPTTGLPL